MTIEHPEVGSKWMHRRAKRAAVVMGIRSTPEGVLVDFKYTGTFGASGLWMRGVRPVQTMAIATWSEFFTKPAAP